MQEQHPDSESRFLAELPPFFRSQALSIPGIYFLVGGLWLLGFDWLLATIAPSLSALIRFQDLKSWVLLLATVWLLQWLLKRFEQKLKPETNQPQWTEEAIRECKQRFRQITGTINEVLWLSSAEQALCESEQFLRNIVDSAAEAIWVVEQLEDGEFAIVSMNRSVEQATNTSVDAWINKRLDELWDRKTATCIRAHYHDCLRQGKTISYEEDLPFNDQIRTFLTTLSPLPDQQGRTRLLGINMDITARKQAENSIHFRNKELLTLYKISQIALSNQSLKTAFQEIVEEISTATGFPIVAIELYDKARQVMVFEGIKGIPAPSDGSPVEVPVAQTASGTVASTGQPLVKIYDPQESKKCDSNETLSKLGIQTFICVPMTVHQDTIGTLSLAHPEVVQTDNYFLQWITSLANYLALLTDHKRSEKALRESEKFFQLSLDFTHIGSWDWHVATNEVLWNENHARLLGLVPSEVKSSYQAWRDRVHPEDVDRVEQAVTDAIETQTDFEAEYRVLHPDGSLHWLIGRGRGIYDESGRFARMIGVILDITDRKQAEQEIRTLNKTLEQQNLKLETLVEQRTIELLTLINTLPDYIFVIERQEMKFLFCNDRNARFSGFTNRQQMEGKTIFECFPPEVAAKFALQNQQVFESGETLHFQRLYSTPQGVLHLDTYKIPLKHPSGEVYALIGAARDITELVATRQAIADRTIQLEAANRELESFSYSVSHDLRAPLRHINGFVAALTNQLQQSGLLTDPKVAHYLQVIQESSQKMGSLVDGLLTLSRVGRRQLVDVPVNLNQVVQSALEQLSAETAPGSSPNSVRDSQLIQFVIGDLPIVLGDATLLLQVFVNLLDNARKFSRDRRPAQIEIGTLADGTIFVRDNGVGFQMEYADQLFGAFQRLHSQSEFEGTGIGLAIVQRIVHRHGGTIWAESQPNQGTTFFLRIGNRPEEPGHPL
jgi:PAS domain S-box-containing protein